MTEDQLEHEALSWLAELGFTTFYGPDLAADGKSPERSDYVQVVLIERLRAAIKRLNPGIPLAARDDALQQVLNLEAPGLLAANRRFHQLLVNGVPVQYQLDGETRGDFVRLIDWNTPSAQLSSGIPPSPQPSPDGRGSSLNEYLAVNQFAIKGPKHSRRPDIILFINGLPLVLLELKNPADENADIWKAFDQIQTYKEQIPDVFQYNGLLVISDGSEARLGALSSDAERFMQWRTIDGVMLDPLGQFNELETLIHGLLNPSILLDYLRFFVLFEDDGGLVKKVAAYHQYHAVRAATSQVVAASKPDGSHKGGVVWHTQGSGKSLVLLELKNPADENADIWKAFDQIQTYKEQIPDVFQYNGLLVISDGSEARLGALSSDAERFMQWRTIDGVMLDPLGQFNELETLIHGLLNPSILLDYLRFFVLFEDDGGLVKKVAAYHQYHAVRAATSQVVAASKPDGSHKGGVVWHTQGSGKSITMTCFAARVMQEAAMENPTIVVITDRNDLDGQLYGVFSLGQDLLREQPVQAETRQDLRAKLSKRPSGGIIFATIQKFMPGADEDMFPMLSDRNNIVVIADEAHRTQYGFEAKLKLNPHPTPSPIRRGVSTLLPQGRAQRGGRSRPGMREAPASYQAQYQVGYAQHLRDALPNATFVAFTGTPVSLEDRDTRAVFGEYIHVYDMQQAKEDGATVAIYFESRLAKLALRPEQLPQIDDEVDELAEDEEEDQQAKLKSRWAALEKVVGAEPRIASVAADLVTHFEERNKAQDGKAMVVAMSREICVHLYNEIISLRPDWHDADPEKGVIKIVMTGSASDKALLRPHIYNKQIKKRLEKRFKDPADPLRLVIVRDMWLTGFDAPCVHTLYVDKPMKGHNLMQAIARVNRVFKDKQGGLVVDYIGIANELKSALKDYTASQGRGRPTVDAAEAYAVLEEKLDILRGLLHGYDYSDFLSSGHKRLAGAANHVLGQKDGKKRFADTALAMSKAFTLCCTLDEAKAVREEVAFFQAVKVILTKRDISRQKRTDEERDLAIRQIINSAVVSEDVVDIFEAVGLDKPNIGILDDDFLSDVRNLPERNLAVELLERLLEGEIKSRFAGNVVQEKKFSELLANVIKRYQNRAIETAQVIEELIGMAKKFREAAGRGEILGLSEDEVRFYDALADNESAVRELSDETLKKIAHELTENLRQNITVDWSQRESVRARLRLMVKRILRKYKYPPDRQETAVELILQQAQALGEAWV